MMRAFRLVLVAASFPLQSVHSDSDYSIFGVGESADGCNHFLDELKHIVSIGELSLARWRSLEVLGTSPGCKNAISKAYINSFQESYDERGILYVNEIENSSTLQRNLAKKDRINCTKSVMNFGVFDLNQLWDKHCSILPSYRDTTEYKYDLEIQSLTAMQNPFYGAYHMQRLDPCCEFSPGSWAYLRLPALMEPAVRLRIPLLNGKLSNNDDITMDLEQDGYLRPFDVAGILWPAGYLLSLCLGNLEGCPIAEVRALLDEYQERLATNTVNNNHPPLAIELGTGIGAGAIAFAKSLQRMRISSLSHHQVQVVATDVAPHSLGLTMANANSNKVQIGTTLMDHFDPISVQNVKRNYFPPTVNETSSRNMAQPQGFSIVFGSSLQGLFKSNSALSNLLDELLDRKNPNAIAIFAHTQTEPLEEHLSSSIASFRLVRRISGSHQVFGPMMTRAGGDSSDFELCIFQRSSE